MYLLNNKFYFDKDDKVIVISEGSYEIREYKRVPNMQFYNLVPTILRERKRFAKRMKSIRANNSIMKNEMKTRINFAYRINFTKPHNIGSLFSSNRVLEPRQWIRWIDKYHHVNIIRIECNVTANAYSNMCAIHECVHAMHEFRRVCRQDIRYRKNYDLHRSFTFQSSYGAYITNLTLRIVDQDSRLLDFRRGDHRIDCVYTAISIKWQR